MHILNKTFNNCGGPLVISLMVLCLCGMLIALTGCEQAPPPPSPSKVEKTEPPPAVEPAEEAEEDEERKPEYSYDPSNRREPFKTLIAEELPEVEDVIATPDPTLPKTELQKFDINQLQLTGIILGSLGEYARLTAPDGKAYTIKVGTLVGKYEGKVVSIADNVVLVKEIVRYESGKIEEVETPLYLNPIEEEK